MDGIERFVINTGRSGSTMLSTMFNENRRLLSCSEFMAALGQTNRYPPGPMDADQLVERVMAIGSLGRLMAQRNISFKEVIYDTSLGRHNGRLDMPTVLNAALPLMQPDDPDALFDDMVAWARQQPTRTIGDHYRELLAWLTEHLGRDGWVERSGASIRYFGETYDVFPTARYLHLHRDGPECALSMYEHNWFALAVQYHEYLPTEGEIEEAFRRPRLDDSDPVTRYYGKDKPSYERYGAYWTYQICKGFREFGRVRPEQLLQVRFEDLIADPITTLDRIDDFFELPDDPGWKERAAALVRGDLRPRVPDLASDERAQLEAACLPGQVLVGRCDPTLLDEATELIGRVWNRLEIEGALPS